MIEKAWEEWKIKHNKKYEDEEEHSMRFKIWKEAEDYIIKHNSEKHSFKIGHNKFSDLTTEEFSTKYKGFNAALQASTHDSSKFKLSAVNIPKSVDWRTQGYVNPVQDQGQCGCCYAFSACAAIEGQYFKTNGTLVKLSEQNLVDCSSSYGNNGGNGGTMDNCFRYVKDNGGLDTEESYPYQAEAGSCKYKPENSGATVDDFIDLPEGDENALTSAIATMGPISVGIDASQRSFQLYKSGVYDDPKCSQTPDHAVCCVGYGVEDGVEYYLVRNSWGTSWGEDGYIKMSRNKENQAGIANMASTVVYKSKKEEDVKTTDRGNSMCSYI